MPWILNLYSINICLTNNIITWILHPNLAVVLISALQIGNVFDVIKCTNSTNLQIIVCIENFRIISVTYKCNVLFIENQVTSTMLFPDTSGAVNSKEPLSQQSLVVSNGKRSLYSFVKADPLATAMKLQDSEEKLITETYDIRSEFNILFTTVLEDLVSKGVNVRRFVLFLKEVPGYGTQQGIRLGTKVLQASCQKMSSQEWVWIWRKDVKMVMKVDREWDNIWIEQCCPDSKCWKTCPHAVMCAANVASP